MRVRFILSWAVALISASGMAEAAMPSFDCLKAASGMERLICADGGLAALDEALAEAYGKRRKALNGADAQALAREQREWLKRRNACPVPAIARDGQFTPEQVWQAAPCVAAHYRERLAALGAAAPDTTLPAGAIHPLCVAQAANLGEGQSVPVPLKACTKGNAHNPASPFNNLLTAEGTRDTPIGVAWTGYRNLGQLADGRDVVLVYTSGGGTGMFSSILALARQPHSGGEVMLNAQSIAPGGDRCNGGIDDAKVKSGKLIISRNVTPAALVAEARGGTSSPADADLPDCAACCIGTVTTSRPLAGGEEKLVSATIVGTEALEPEGDANRAAGCLVRAVGNGTGATPRTLDPAALAELGRQYESCLGGKR